MVDVLFFITGRRAVIPAGGDLCQTGRAPIQRYNLSAAAVRVAGGVHLHKGGGFLDDPVQLGRDDVVILGLSHEQGLAAAFLGKEQPARRQGGLHHDGMGAGKVGYRHPESVLHPIPFTEIPLNPQGNDLGIGGNLRRQYVPVRFVLGLQFLVIVNIPVQTDLDEGPPAAVPVGGAVVHRVAVGFGDRPHRGPPGMRGHGRLVPGKSQQSLKNRIPKDLLAQKADIFPETADFGGKFVDKGQGHPMIVYVPVKRHSLVVQHFGIAAFCKGLP